MRFRLPASRTVERPKPWLVVATPQKDDPVVRKPRQSKPQPKLKIVEVVQPPKPQPRPEPEPQIAEPYKPPPKIITRKLEQPIKTYRTPGSPWSPLQWVYSFTKSNLPMAIYQGVIEVLGIQVNGESLPTEAPNDGQLYVRESERWVALTDLDGGNF